MGFVISPNGSCGSLRSALRFEGFGFADACAVGFEKKMGVLVLKFLWSAFKEVGTATKYCGDGENDSLVVIMEWTGGAVVGMRCER